MKLIKQSYTILGTPKSLEDAWNFVEKATRCCYQSERKDTVETSEAWCRRILIKHSNRVKNHGAMLEHGTIYLTLTHKQVDYVTLFTFYNKDKYSKVTFSSDNKTMFITTSLRVVIENRREKDLQYCTAPSEHHCKRITVKFITNRAMLAELTRHRVFSFAVESTRFCNYSSNKFGNELTFIHPCWMPDLQEDDWNPIFHAFYQIEKDYFQLIADGWQPQQAATILPNALKTTVFMTGFISDWEHLFKLRSSQGVSGTPHPQMVELIDPVMKNFYEKGYIDNQN